MANGKTEENCEENCGKRVKQFKAKGTSAWGLEDVDYLFPLRKVIEERKRYNEDILATQMIVYRSQFLTLRLSQSHYHLVTLSM
ncbi:hypothetical protein EVAR_41612_1 [Eumeta japonica]|uniref:Uncharacterized protein n=1 Tax=Eumeta variegata TaxID=151549 RepID=A0A4C1X3D8_EUMVA|nr:hypothetical protein EVAR_41612_1 [Eumeta japonica]